MTRFEFATALKELLTPELGLFPSGTPAIWEDAGDCPGGAKGLLCLIERQPNLAVNQAILNHQAESEFDWVCRLIQSDRTQSGLAILDRACEKIRDRFPNHRERPLAATDRDPPQIAFLCRFYTLRNTLSA